MFEKLEPLPMDPVASVYMAYGQDPNPSKMDLGIGVYRNDAGESPILESVRQAETRLLKSQSSKSYKTPDGNSDYCRKIERLVLGEDHPALRDNRVHSVQTPGAGGGLRAAAEFLKDLSPKTRVWTCRPNWEHQLVFIRGAGLELAEYPYYDRQSNQLLFDQMLDALQGADPGDAVLLHGCCHNPTGADLSPDQWRELTDVIIDRALIPVIDLVYQGFGDGLDEDAFGSRHLAASVPEMILVSSSSKSFSIYRDRAGTASLIFDKKGRAAEQAPRHLTLIALSLYFMPPDGGAAIVNEILGDPALATIWRRELNDMRGRIVSLRNGMKDALSQKLPDYDFDFLEHQNGMFSLLPLESEDLLALQKQHGIYMMPDARINFAALSNAKVDLVASAIANVLSAKRRDSIQNAG